MTASFQATSLSPHEDTIDMPLCLEEGGGWMAALDRWRHRYCLHCGYRLAKHATKLVLACARLSKGFDGRVNPNLKVRRAPSCPAATPPSAVPSVFLPSLGDGEQAVWYPPSPRMPWIGRAQVPRMTRIGRDAGKTRAQSCNLLLSIRKSNSSLAPSALSCVGRPGS